MHFSTATIALVASMMPMASAHYFFDKLVLPDGTVSADYVRQNTRQTKYMPTKWKNTFDNTTPDSIDFRCNVGATTKGAKGTAKVKAGDTLSMTLGVGATMRHPGPIQVYMAKSATTAAASDGSEGWFKIKQEGICNTSGDIKGTAWCSWDKDRITFQVPTNIPSGDYLARVEHIGVHGAHDGQAEFYYACAQLSVSEGSGSLPTDLVKIPGVYKSTDPEVLFSVWGGMKPYPAKGPGPAVFSGSSGGSSGGSSNGSPAGLVASSSPVASPAPGASAAPSPTSPSNENPPAGDYPPTEGGNNPSQGGSNPTQGGNNPSQSGNPTQGNNPNDDYPSAEANPPTNGQPAMPKPSCNGYKARRHARDLAL